MTPVTAPEVKAPEVTPTQVLPDSLLRSAAESAFRDRKEQDLERLQAEIDAITAKAVTANFEPFRDAAEDLLRILRLAFGQVARFVEGDFRQQASFYLGQLHALAEIAEKARQRRLPRRTLRADTAHGRRSWIDRGFGFSERNGDEGIQPLDSMQGTCRT